MKFFVLIDSPDLKYSPKLTEWHKRIDVRNIRIDKYPKLAEQELFIIKSEEKVIFTDIILFPFLLVTPMVKDVIEMYGDTCFFRKIILLDQVHQKSELYYLPILDETDKIQLALKNYDENGQSSNTKTFTNNSFTINKNIFWVRDSMKKHTVISLDLAESLLRRNVVGLGIQEVVLHN